MGAFFMSKITQNAAVAAKPKRLMTTKTLAYCALLTAIQVVLARLIVPMPAADPSSWPACCSAQWPAVWSVLPPT